MGRSYTIELSDKDADLIERIAQSSKRTPTAVVQSVVARELYAYGVDVRNWLDHGHDEPLIPMVMDLGKDRQGDDG